MPFKASCLQSISFIMRFDFQKYSSPVSPVKKVNKKPDSLTAARVCRSISQNSSFILVVFNKIFEKFRDDSPGVKYIFTW